METSTILGLVAGAITSFSFLPQVIKTLRMRSAHDVSIEMFSFLSFGIFLWIIYGLLIGSLPVILANCIALIFTLAMVFLKIRYR